MSSPQTEDDDTQNRTFAFEDATTNNHNHIPTSTPPSAAWLKVLGCFFMYVATWGMSTSFGVYQSHYQLHMLDQYSASTISWIGTVQVFLFFFVSIISGPFFDTGYRKTLFYVGCAAVVFSFFMLSLARELYQIVLTQGVCFGIGSGLLFVPAITDVSNAFDTKRSLALGLAATGSAVGGTVFPIMFRALVPAIGFTWTNRVFGFIEITLFIPAVWLLNTQGPGSQQELNNRSDKLYLDLRAFRETPFTFLCVGLFFVELGFWIPPFTIVPYAQLSLGASADYAFYLLAIMNGGSFAGRILPALAADVQSIGPGWVLVAGTLVLSALVLAWVGIHDLAGITAWSVAVGFVSGIAVSIPNAVLPKISPPSSAGARSGMMWAIVAFAALIGSPLAGLLVDPSMGSFRNGQLFSGLSICAGSIMLCVPAVQISRKRMD